ncbi:MAG: MgtC/SapB family protein [Acidobacteria bacterium]|nr:MgtC/SapB family protein [Acidobacteriota bacterium]MBI3426151.1 MgtC/SapB family protein [Acidobacteriota bacterium]
MIQISNQEILLRLLLAFFCGALIGIERQSQHKMAGLKTNCLVALGATNVTLVALLGFSNPAQVATGVITGIGFLGAGVIIHQGASVQGINSAATLWVTAGIGMALGIGRYTLALAVLVITLIEQVFLRALANWLDRRMAKAKSDSGKQADPPTSQSPLV